VVGGEHGQLSQGEVGDGGATAAPGAKRTPRAGCKAGAGHWAWARLGRCTRGKDFTRRVVPTLKTTRTRLTKLADKLSL
jgi:hypothetical protein